MSRRPQYLRTATAGACLLALAVSGCTSIQLGSSLGPPDAQAPTLPLAEAWERDAQGAFGPGAPLITTRYVVVGTRRGEVVVLDRETGDTEGVGEFGDSVEGQLATSENGQILYVATAERGGGVEAYDVQRGRRIWRWRGGPTSGGVVRIGTRLVVPLLNGTLAGLDIASGDVLWERPLATGTQIHAAPVAAAEDVIVADDRGYVRRIDPATGDDRWSVSVEEPIYATPTVGEGALVVTTTRGHVVRIGLEEGEAVWRSAPAPGTRATPVAIAAGRLAVGFTDGTTRVLDLETGQEHWSHLSDGNIAATPSWVDGQVVVGTMDRRLLVLDGDTGEEVWSRQLRGRVKSALGVGGGLLVALVEPRHVIAFEASP
ncbi:MAG: PQQ-binding-like beta-propeller repeat protein [Bacteroidota bacterium]